jgi:hypothetical protein
MLRPSPLLRVLVFSLSAGCATPSGPWEHVASADKLGWTTTARDGRVAFLDGAEASTDPAIVGVELRVVGPDGRDVLRAPTDGSARATALLADAAATLELTSSVLDQRVVIRPLDGSPRINVMHAHTPLALTASENGLVWVEVERTALEDVDHDGTFETGVFALTLVDADARGAVQRRTSVTLDGGLRGPTSILAPFPSAFGLAIDGDAAYFGWGTRICGGRYEVLRVARADGAASVAWQGAAADTGPVTGNTCECADVADNVTEEGEALAFLDHRLVVVGSVYRCASVVADVGFVALDGTSTPVDDAVREATSDADGVFVATGRHVFAFDGMLSVLPVDPPAAVRGLALDRDPSGARALFVTTDDGVVRRAL